MFIKASHPLRLVTTSLEGQSQLHKHHFWSWDTSSVYSFKRHLKEPLAQSLTLAAIRMLSLSWFLNFWFSRMQFLCSLRKEPSYLFIHLNFMTQAFLLNVHPAVNLPSHSFSMISSMRFFYSFSRGLSTEEENASVVGREGRGGADGWRQLQAVWRGRCYQCAIEMTTLFWKMQWFHLSPCMEEEEEALFYTSALGSPTHPVLYPLLSRAQPLNHQAEALHWSAQGHRTSL